jgi:hypothetical protein
VDDVVDRTVVQDIVTQVDVECGEPLWVTRIERVFEVGETSHTLSISLLSLILLLDLILLRLIRSSLATAGRSAGGVYI